MVLFDIFVSKKHYFTTAFFMRLFKKTMDPVSKTLSIAIVAATGAYSFWLFGQVQGIFGGILFVCEMLMSSTALLFIFNHWTQDHTFRTQQAPKGSLDIFVTVVNEPLSIFTPTVEAASKINYQNKKLYILDDGGREDVQKIAAFYGATYISRHEKVDRKAGNLNAGLAHSKGMYVLVLDADQVATSNIAEDLLGYFRNDKNIAIISTRQQFDVPINDFNHDIAFYQHAQAGKNADNAAISCGSGVFYRRTALLSIGGFQTWNIVEDLYTSYVLHSRGWKSIYINKAYTIGTAPLDIPMIYKQRGTWALDTLRLFIKKSPFLEPGLSFRQKMHYTEMAWAYIVPALGVATLFLLPAIALFFNVHMVANELQYLYFRVTFISLLLVFFYRLNGNSLVSTQYWGALSFIYLHALMKAVCTNDMRYRVTEKFSSMDTEIKRILPHLLYVLVNAGALLWYISYNGPTLSPYFLYVNTVWTILMLLCFFPIIKKGLFPRSIALHTSTELLSLEEPLNLLKFKQRIEQI